MKSHDIMLDGEDAGQVEAHPALEGVRMSESELLKGLFAAGVESEDYTSSKKTLHINRDGKTLFMFDVRPISEDELLACRKKATKYHENPAGRRYPKIEGDTDFAMLRSLKIYTATTEEYKNALWNNPQAMDKYNALEGYQVIDKVLYAGEKDAIIDKIDEISGYGSGSDLEAFAKN